jgi:hypothetical protein
MIRDRGFTPTQLRQIDDAVRAALAELPAAPVCAGADPRRIEFRGSLDSRQLVGNITDGIVHYALEQITAAPAAIVGRLSRWAGIR